MADRQLIKILDEIILDLDSKTDSEIQASFESAKNGPVSTAFSQTGLTPVHPSKNGE